MQFYAVVAFIEHFFVPSVSQSHGLLDVPESLASAFDINHLAMVKQSIQVRGGKYLVAG
jgi:hypothetical protein